MQSVHHSTEIELWLELLFVPHHVLGKIEVAYPEDLSHPVSHTPIYCRQWADGTASVHLVMHTEPKSCVNIIDMVYRKSTQSGVMTSPVFDTMCKGSSLDVRDGIAALCWTTLFLYFTNSGLNFGQFISFVIT